MPVDTCVPDCLMVPPSLEKAARELLTDWENKAGKIFRVDDNRLWQYGHVPKQEPRTLKDTIEAEVERIKNL